MKTTKKSEVEFYQNLAKDINHEFTPAEIQHTLEHVQNHPKAEEIIGCGVKTFKFGKDNWGKWTMFVVRKDNTTENFSIMNAIKLHNRPTEVFYQQRALNALRNEVAEQIVEFKKRTLPNGAIIKCPITNESLIDWKTAHVDHWPKSFEALVNEWFTLHKLSLVELKTIDREEWGGRLLSDATEKDSWQVFHRENAQLRLVSKHANLSECRAPSGKQT